MKTKHMKVRIRALELRTEELDARLRELTVRVGEDEGAQREFSARLLELEGSTSHVLSTFNSWQREHDRRKREAAAIERSVERATARRKAVQR